MSTSESTVAESEVPTIAAAALTEGRKTWDHEIGDLICIPVNGKWIVAEVVEVSPLVSAAWGDFVVQVPTSAGKVALRSEMSSGAGQLIGRPFDSWEDARDALRPFWKGRAS